jgi:hypothetical protein
VIFIPAIIPDNRELSVLINLSQEPVAYSFTAGESASLYFNLLHFSALETLSDLPTAKASIILSPYPIGLPFLP